MQEYNPFKMSQRMQTQYDSYTNAISPYTQMETPEQSYTRDMADQGLVRSDAVEQVKEQEDDDFGFFDYAIDPFVGIVKGGVDFAESIGELADAGVELFGGDLIADDEWDWSEKLGLQTETYFGTALSGITQFAVSYALPAGFIAKGASAVVKGTKLAEAGTKTAKVAGYAGTLGRGAVADAVAFKSNEARLSNMLEGTAVDNALTSYLAADDDDGILEGRLKNAIEGAFIAPVADALFAGFRGAKNMITDKPLDESVVESITKGRDDTTKGSLEKNIEAMRTAFDKDKIKADTDALVKKWENGDVELYTTSGDILSRKDATTAEIQNAAIYEVVGKKSFDTFKSGYYKPEQLKTEIDFTNTNVDVRVDARAQQAAAKLGKDNVTFDSIASRIDEIHANKLDGNQSIVYVKETADAEFDAIFKKAQETASDDEIVDNIVLAFAKDAGIPQRQLKKLKAEVNSVDKAKQLYKKHKAIRVETKRVQLLAAKKDLFDNAFQKTSPYYDAATIDFIESMERISNLLASAKVGKSGDVIMRIDEKTIAGDLKKFVREKEEANVKARKALRQQKSKTRSVKEQIEEVSDLLSEKQGWDIELSTMQQAVRVQDLIGDKLNLIGGEEAIEAMKKAVNNMEPSMANRPQSMAMLFDASYKPVGKQSPMGRMVHGAMSVHRSVFYNAVLSNPATLGLNIISNVIYSNLELAARAIGGAVTLDGKAVSEAGTEFVGQLYAIKDSLRAALKVLRTGENILDPKYTKLDPATGKSMTERASKQANETAMYEFFGTLPMRSLAAGDEFAKQMAYRSKRYAKARQEIAKRKANGEEVGDDFIQNYIDAGISKADESYMFDEDSIKHARQVTFTNSFDNAFLKNLEELTRSPGWQGEIARTFVPFFKTPMNVAIAGAKYTPFMNALGLVPFLRKGPITAADKGRVVIGALVGMAAYGMYHAGMLSGNASSNPDIARMQREMRPDNSIMIPGIGWVGFDAMPGVGSALKLTANFMQFLSDKSLPEEERKGLAAAFVQSVAGGLISDEFMGDQFKNAIDVLTGDEYAMKRFVAGRASAYVPNILGVANKDVDMATKADGIIEQALNQIYAKIPGMSDQLDPKRNVLGEYDFNKPAAKRLLDPTKSEAVKKDIVLDELIDKNISIREMESKLNVNGSVDLKNIKWSKDSNQSAYDRMLHHLSTQRIGGKTLREKLEDLIQSPQYQSLPSVHLSGVASDRKKMIQKVMNDYKNAAKNTIKKEVPELVQLEVVDDYRVEQRRRGEEQSSVEEVIDLLGLSNGNLQKWSNEASDRYKNRQQTEEEVVGSTGSTETTSSSPKAEKAEEPEVWLSNTKNEVLEKKFIRNESVRTKGYDDQNPNADLAQLIAEGKVKGVVTVGVGHAMSGDHEKRSRKAFKEVFGDAIKWEDVRNGKTELTQEQAMKLVRYDIKEKVELSKELFPDIESYPDYVAEALVDGVFRGDHKSKYNTTKLIIKGSDTSKSNEERAEFWYAAAKEYLNRNDYDNADENGMSGLKDRLEENQAAFLIYADELAGKEPRSVKEILTESTIPKISSYPTEVKQAVFEVLEEDFVVKGALAGPKTIDHINAGEWRKAAAELINRRDYSRDIDAGKDSELVQRLNAYRDIFLKMADEQEKKK